MQVWVQIISTVGFPIAAFLIAAYGLKYAYDKSMEQNSAALDKIGDLTQAVNNNTLVLSHLVDKLEDGGK